MASSDESKIDASKAGVFFADESDTVFLAAGSNYEQAEKMAREELKRLDPVRQAKRCGATVVEEKKTRTVVEVVFFGEPVRVTFPTGEVFYSSGDDEVPIWERILLLHYFEGDSPPPTHTELIGFAQVPSGGFYADAYRKRSHEPLASFFGERPELLLEAGKSLGADREDIGDAAVRVTALPKVQVVTVVHAADDEFPADAKLLYDSSVIAYFCTEDIAVLGGITAGRLIMAARKLRSDI